MLLLILYLINGGMLGVFVLTYKIECNVPTFLCQHLNAKKIGSIIFFKF